jgi:hypothetical protein
VTGAYAIWRVVGGCLVVGGFWSLAGAIGLSRFQKSLAVWLCAFGGGFGWLVFVCERSGLIPVWPAATVDLSDAIHPFTHIFANPHLSVSHGLSLLFLAAFATGERTGKVRWYAMAAGLAVMHALTRPYDLIVMYGVVPAFIVVECCVSRDWSWRKNGARLLPLIVCAPIVAYYAELFRFHPVFKFWASQGDVRTTPLPWQFWSFGLAGLLFLMRLGSIRRYPLSSSRERWLVLWIAGVLFLMHGKSLPGMGLIPFSPVFGLMLPSVMLVVGACLLEPIERLWTNSPTWRRMMLVAALVAMNALGSAVWYLKVLHNLAHFPDHYLSAAEYEAEKWLAGHAGKSDVTLSTLPSGNRLAREVSCRFVLGHWSVTPHVRQLSSRVDRYYSGALSDADALALLDELQVDWIYFGPRERALGKFDPGQHPGVVARFENEQVRLFSRER